MCSGDSPEGHRMLLIIYASCHLLAMTSVCTNPVMYGFLNENFKQVHDWVYTVQRNNQLIKFWISFIEIKYITAQQR